MVISRRYYKKAPDVLSEIYKMIAIIKYLTPHLILDLNKNYIRIVVGMHFTNHSQEEKIVT